MSIAGIEACQGLIKLMLKAELPVQVHLAAGAPGMGPLDVLRNAARSAKTSSAKQPSLTTQAPAEVTSALYQLCIALLHSPAHPKLGRTFSLKLKQMQESRAQVQQRGPRSRPSRARPSTSRLQALVRQPQVQQRPSLRLRLHRGRLASRRQRQT